MVEAIREGDIPGVQLRRRQQLTVGVEEAWRWLTEAPLLERWLADEVKVVAGTRGGFSLAVAGEQGVTVREEASTVEWLPPGRWVLAFAQRGAGWGAATRLTLEVASHPLGCELSVLQQGFEHLPLSDCLTIWEAYRRRWRDALDRLAQALAS